MSMILLSRAQNLQAAVRRLSMPTNLQSVITSFGMGSNRFASSSSNVPPSGMPQSTGTPKYPFKVVPMEVKPPEQYNVLPDPIEHATGIEKKQLLAQLQGDDRYEQKVYHMRAGTKDDPNLIPSHLEARIVGCICEPDQQYVMYMWVRKEEPKRCMCGHWFKVVDAEEDLFY